MFVRFSVNLALFGAGWWETPLSRTFRCKLSDSRLGACQKKSQNSTKQPDLKVVLSCVFLHWCVQFMFPRLSGSAESKKLKTARTWVRIPHHSPAPPPPAPPGPSAVRRDIPATLRAWSPVCRLGSTPGSTTPTRVPTSDPEPQTRRPYKNLRPETRNLQP